MRAVDKRPDVWDSLGVEYLACSAEGVGGVGVMVQLQVR